VTDNKLPSSVREFNEITGVIFAQLYAAFPMIDDIDADAVAKALGHSLAADPRNHQSNRLRMPKWLRRRDAQKSSGTTAENLKKVRRQTDQKMKQQTARKKRSDDPGQVSQSS
jgi:hypothetical protein